VLLGEQAKMAATTAPMPSTIVPLVASSSGPKMRPASDTPPPKAMNHNAITRPRTSSLSSVCRTVNIDVVVAK
jgi:hypothetical protein